MTAAAGAREALRAALERRLLALWFPPREAGTHRPSAHALAHALLAPLAALPAAVSRRRR